MTKLLLVLLLGFVHGESKRNVIVLPKLIQFGGFVLLLYFGISGFFGEASTKEVDATPFPSIIDLKPKAAWHDLEEEDLYSKSTQELLELFEEVQDINPSLAEVVRDVLLPRYIGVGSFDFNKIMPNGVYVITVTCVGTDAWRISIIADLSTLLEVKNKPGYVGSIEIFKKENGLYDFISNSAYPEHKDFVRSLVTGLLRGLGYEEEGAQPSSIMETFPEKFSDN